MRAPRALVAAGKPAVNKLLMLPKVEAMLSTKRLHSELLDGGLLGGCAGWMHALGVLGGCASWGRRGRRALAHAQHGGGWRCECC